MTFSCLPARMDNQCSTSNKNNKSNKTTAKQKCDPRIRCAHDGSCHHCVVGESLLCFKKKNHACLHDLR